MFSSQQQQLNERLLQQDLCSRTVVSHLATMPEGNLPVFVLDTDVEVELSNKSPIELSPRIVVTQHQGQVLLALIVLELNPESRSTLCIDSGKDVATMICENPLIAFCVDLTNTHSPVVPHLLARNTTTSAFKIMLCESLSDQLHIEGLMSMAASWAECLTLTLPTSTEFMSSNSLSLNTVL